MSPLGINMLLHFHCSAAPFPETGNAQRQVITFLKDEGMIEHRYSEENDGKFTGWKTTAKGDFYVQHLCSQPLPQPTFYIPEK